MNSGDDKLIFESSESVAVVRTLQAGLGEMAAWGE